ncbi:MAG: hypothetical protein LBD24_08510, partial [Spirochaetaceae bacterium]|nr:hypothetical protein [Spirochaetaceae bacterium]
MLCAVRGGALFGALRITLMKPSETALFGVRRGKPQWGVWGVYDPPAAGGSLSVVARFGALRRTLM